MRKGEILLLITAYKPIIHRRGIRGLRPLPSSFGGILSKINTVAVSIDPETLAWFRSKGAESDRHMAAALKIYADARKAAVKIL